MIALLLIGIALCVVGCIVLAVQIRVAPQTDLSDTALANVGLPKYSTKADDSRIECMVRS